MTNVTSRYVSEHEGAILAIVQLYLLLQIHMQNNQLVEFPKPQCIRMVWLRWRKPKLQEIQLQYFKKNIYSNNTHNPHHLRNG